MGREMWKDVKILFFIIFSLSKQHGQEKFNAEASPWKVFTWWIIYYNVDIAI